jgi:hypothetical protein
MLGDFVLELVVAPGTGIPIGLPNVAPAGRIPWSQRFTYRQPIFYILDDTKLEEWGYGTFIPGTPAQITRDTVLGNSAGTTARLNFAGTTRCYSAWPAAAMEAALGANSGRNLFHNSMFNIQQRGVGPFAIPGYTADRWLYGSGTGGGSRTVTVQVMPDVGRAQIGDEEPANFLQSAFVGGSAAGDFDQIAQRIESVRKTAGRLVTVSFWATAQNPPPFNVAINWVQNFGAGGSASVNGTAQVRLISATSNVRYSATFVVPNVQGKTLGTAGTDYFEVDLWLSSGSTNNVLAGGIGVQSGTLDLWGMQCEVAPVATPLERPDPRVDLAQCQRFYQAIPGLLCSGYDSAGGAVFTEFALLTPMRVAPSVTFSGAAFNNASGLVLNAATPTQARFRILATATGNCFATFAAQLTADL